MSNQGWSRLPSRDRTLGERIFDALLWPWKKLFFGIAAVLLLLFRPRR